ncbi:MAG: hypothetical protein LBS57_12540 [Treponema sp.]|nr:hypothetical protein [Treponema sp.]
MIVIFILVSLSVFPQDSNNRILDFLDDVLNAAVEAGKEAPSAPQQPAANRPSFYILNNTGFTVKNIYVCPANSENWGANIFTGAYLYNGQSVHVMPDQFPDGTRSYNIRLVDVDGDRYSKYDVEISDHDTVRIGIDDFDFEK